MLRIEERSPRDNDETGHVSACRKVKSQFRFVRILSLALRSRAPDRPPDLVRHGRLRVYNTELKHAQ